MPRPDKYKRKVIRVNIWTLAVAAAGLAVLFVFAAGGFMYYRSVNRPLREMGVEDAIYLVIDSGDVEEWERWMTDPFVLTYWEDGSIVSQKTIPRDEALAEIEADILPDDPSVLALAARPDRNPVEDYVNTSFPFVVIHDTALMENWGPDAQGQAVIVVAIENDDGLGWYALVYAPEGF